MTTVSVGANALAVSMPRPEMFVALRRPGSSALLPSLYTSRVSVCLDSSVLISTSIGSSTDSYGSITAGFSERSESLAPPSITTGPPRVLVVCDCSGKVRANSVPAVGTKFGSSVRLISTAVYQLLEANVTDGAFGTKVKEPASLEITAAVVSVMTSLVTSLILYVPALRPLPMRMYSPARKPSTTQSPPSVRVIVSRSSVSSALSAMTTPMVIESATSLRNTPSARATFDCPSTNRLTVTLFAGCVVNRNV